MTKVAWQNLVEDYRVLGSPHLRAGARRESGFSMVQVERPTTRSQGGRDGRDDRCGGDSRPRPQRPHRRSAAGADRDPGPALDPAFRRRRGATVGFARARRPETPPPVAPSSAPAARRTRCRRVPPAAPAVQAHAGSTVEFTLPSAANAITVRYSIPDASDGGGSTGTARPCHGERRAPQDITLTLSTPGCTNPVPVLPTTRTGDLAASRLVDHECSAYRNARHRRRDHKTVPAQPLLDEQRGAARPHLPEPARRFRSPPRRPHRDDLLRLATRRPGHVALVRNPGAAVRLPDPSGRARLPPNAFDRAITFAQRHHLKGLHPTGPPTR